MDTWHNKSVADMVKSSNELMMECYRDPVARKAVLQDSTSSVVDGKWQEKYTDLRKLGSYLCLSQGPSYSKGEAFRAYQAAQAANPVELKSLFSICALVGLMARNDNDITYMQSARDLFNALYTLIAENTNKAAGVAVKDYRNDWSFPSGGFFVFNDPAITFDGDIDLILSLISNAGFLSFYAMQVGRELDPCMFRLFVKESFTRQFLVDVLTVIRKPTFFKSTANTYKRGWDPHANDNLVMADAQAVYDETLKKRKFLPSLLFVVADLHMLLDSLRPFNMEVFAAETSEGGSFGYVAKHLRVLEDSNYVEKHESRQRAILWETAQRGLVYEKGYRERRQRNIFSRAAALIGGYSPELWYQEIK